MEPAKYDLQCKAGTTFRKSFTFKDRNDNLLDFTGYAARMHVRATIDADTTLVKLATSFDATPEDTLLGSIEIDVPTATIGLLIEDDVTSQFAVGSYVYDIEIESPSGIVDSPLYGKFKVTGEVTR